MGRRGDLCPVENPTDPYARGPDEQLSLDGASVPFWLLHVLALGAFFVPFRWSNVGAFLVAYCLGTFGIMAGYHRYFSHRSFKTGRAFQFVLAALGTLTSQKGVLWWSGHHRNHHKHSDTPEDIHSPRRGFFWSHALWFLAPKYMETSAAQRKEFSQYPELTFLNDYWALGPTLLCATMLALGGLPWLLWGGFLAIVAMWHATFTINSLAHVWGSRRYETSDTSRNNPVLALITFGEGWHNNHHHYQSSARNGFFWWELDATFYVLKALSWAGVVWDLRVPPAWVLAGEAGPTRDAPTTEPAAAVAAAPLRGP
jgi:stearoyl-CoA desaturase (Delta-9 desaturase)